MEGKNSLDLQLPELLDRLTCHEHLGLFYKNPAERLELVIAFIQSGWEQRQQCLYLLADDDEPAMIDALRQGGLGVDAALDTGALIIAPAKRFDPRPGGFEQDALINFLEEAAAGARASGYAALRITGKIICKADLHFNGQALIDYRVKLNRFFAEHAALGIFHYPCRALSPHTWPHLISVHPQVIYAGRVYKNIYYIPPPAEAETAAHDCHLELLLDNLRQRIEASPALVREEQKQTLFLNHISEILVHQDLEHCILWANQAAAASLGLEPQQLLGRHCYELWQHRRQPCPDCPVARAWQTGQSQEAEMVLADGRVWLIRGYPLQDQRNKVAGAIAISLDITASQRTEAALRESEAKFRNLLDYIPGVSIQGYGVDGIVRYWNKASEDVYGYTAEEAIGKNLADLIIPPELKPLFAQGLELGAKATQSGEFMPPGELRLRHKDGSLVPVYSIHTVVCLPNRSPLMFCIDVDLSERLQAEEALQKEKQKFQLLVEQAPLGISLINKKGEYQYVNPKFIELFGYTLEEIPTGKQWFPKAYPDPRYRQEVISTWIKDREAVRPGECRPRTFTVTCKDGSEKIIHFRPVGLENQDYLIIYEDITERSRAEEALKESEERFKILFEYAPDAYFLHDLAGNLIDGNRAAEKLVGFPREELIGQNLLNLPLVETEQKSLVSNVLDQMAQGEAAGPLEFTLNRRDGGKVIAEVKSYPINLRGRSLGLGIAHDITARKKLEEELLKASRIESLSILAGGLAHDFNNLLHGVLGNLSLALTMLNSHPLDELYKMLNAAENACLRATDLTRQLLTFAKGGMPVKKLTIIPDLLKDWVNFALIGSMVQSEFSLSENLWPVEVDQGQLSQVINNLIINAEQAMPQGGMIKVVAENVVIDRSSVIPLKKGRYVKISIIDQGIGIPKGHLSRIFDPYFTTKQKGSGLGLATAYSIIKNHEGYITVDSEIGVGTCFEIYLPASQKKIDTSIQFHPLPLAGQGKILVMDDEPMIRDLVGKMLEKIGYQVDFARDGAEALKLYARAQAEGQPFTAVIMDLTIPGGMGGKEAIKRLLELDPRAKAIVSSGYADGTALLNFREYGFQGIIPKPFRITELSRILHGVIHCPDQVSLT
ncbi:MAG: PAS domain S-box protein [Desulfobacteraceae bacterium]